MKKKRIHLDLKGILYGGIPIKEIQDDYIKEVLNGFDVSSILIRKDNEYMIFKENIKDKSQIRNILGDVSDSVLEQIEKWWDKYGISLNQIEKEVKQSEAAMHEFLKSFNYD